MKKIMIMSSDEIYKEKILQYGRASRQRKVTYDRFEAWLERNGYCLSSGDNHWRATFYAVLRRNFHTEMSYRFDRTNQRLTTIFKVGGLLRL